MGNNAPSGTVTFLFTDIEGSTRLWDRYPDAMSLAMQIHDELLEATVEIHNGYVFSRAGDGWGVSFASPTSAIDAALDVQAVMSQADWPEPIQTIKVRIGLHAGTSTERDGDYFGTAVNRAARVSAVASGGQIFATGAVRSLVIDGARASWRFRDLGEHRLRDLVRAERIWQVDSESAPSSLAELRDQISTGNLPPERTRVIGRSAAVGDVTDMLEENRLVTLVGVGGVGKTTLAQTVARQIQGDFAGGAWFVDLSGVEDHDLVVAVTATALDISLRPDMTTLESLLDALRSERRLIILDNAENQIDAVAELVDTMLNNVVELGLIVTSRETLTIPGEATLRVAPLSVEGDEDGSPAVAMFVDRLSRVAPDLDPASFDESTLGRIVQRLDGLPLAIELAASQCEMMTPHELLEALETEDVTLQSDSRTTAPRHRSLDTMIRWTYDKLDANEKAVFDRLSVFRGGGTTEAARSVCSDPDIPPSDVTTALKTLIRKSLVVPDRLGGVTRVRQLETLRSFAALRLDERGESSVAATRHAAWFGSQASDAREGLVGPDEARLLKGLVAEIENLRAALRWAGENKAWEIMEHIGSTIPFLVESKMRPEMKEWILDALEVLPQDSTARVSYGHAAGLATIYSGALDEAPGVLAAATQHVGERQLVGFFHSYLVLVVAMFRGETETIISDTPRAIKDARELGLERWTAALGVDLALIYHYEGDAERAATALTDVVTYAEESGNPTVLAWARYIQGEILAGSDPAAAIEILEEGVEHGLTVDNDFLAGISLVALASTAGRSGDTPVALNGMQRCIRLWRTAGNRPQMWTAMRNLVEILHTIGMNEDAYILHNATEADAEHAAELFGPFGDAYRAIVAAISEDLGSEASARA
ncbi:MAG: adenylate/guanylate cyclase domain-containing protein, partial [Actinomycetia bacterium]|nr:adenylate/guanylate cyclase domain-containing protein [Actinomycetes bacterium]